MNFSLEMAERGLLPDAVLRLGIRRFLRERLEEQRAREERSPGRVLDEFVAWMNGGPIAPVPDRPNEQHYELPPAFFRSVLGRRMKYSGCFWTGSEGTLEEAEEAMLRLTCERARLQDGMEVLDLGCGWGALALWIAEQYPRCRVHALSNSVPQREHIESEARRLRLDSVRVVTADINEHRFDRRFDRVLSVEMFEHMRNYRELLRRIRSWMEPDGRLFVHVFCHRRYAYAFETEGTSNWMGRFFFTGGIMPSEDLLPRFQEDLSLEERWVVNGDHYRRSAEAWLARLDAARPHVLPILAVAYGMPEAERWFHRWRLFFMACAELFGYGRGEEWYVGHYLFKPGSM